MGKCWQSATMATRTVQSVEAASSQVVGNNDICDGVEYKLNVGGVGGAGLVAVDLLHRTAIHRLKLRLYVQRCLLVGCRACSV